MKESFFHSFTSHRIQNTPQSNINSSGGEAAHQTQGASPIKGIYMGLREKHGTVAVAFYDLRDAAIAKETIETVGVARQMDGDEEDEEILWDEGILCHFISPEHLKNVCLCRYVSNPVGDRLISGCVQLTGKEALISELNKAFRLSSSIPGSDPKMKSGLAPESMRNLLETYGDLYRFEPMTQPTGDGSAGDWKLVCVLYY